MINIHNASSPLFNLADYCNRRSVIIAVFLALLAVIFIRYAEPLRDPDLWWHIELGEYMVKNLTLKPDHSIYSWTIADPNWIYNAWLSEVILYGSYAIGGVAMLHALNYILLGCILVIFLHFNRILKEPLSQINILSMLLIFTALHLNATLLKPETFSYLLTALTVYIYFYSIVRQKDLFWLFPVVMLIWVNTHGGFIFGLVFISTAFAGEVINYLIKRSDFSKERLWHFFMSVLLSFAVLVITPYGYKWIWSLAVHFTDPRF
ncbi:MAG: hypothetical protein L0Y62_01075, partial [Nitrospirae bacterium]|nr:hypothetical protein [Nitrospirota bacterium]